MLRARVRADPGSCLDGGEGAFLQSGGKGDGRRQVGEEA